MRTELVQWLKDNEQITQTTIGPATLSDDGLRFQMSVEGREFTIVFEGVTGGSLDLEDARGLFEDECWESVYVLSLSECDWAQYGRFSIYCSAVLRNKDALVEKIDEHLQSQNAYKTSGDFINPEIGEASNYLLARAPASIRDVICAELTRQNVPFSVLEFSGKVPIETRLWVRIGSSTIYCESAWVESS